MVGPRPVEDSQAHARRIHIIENKHIWLIGFRTGNSQDHRRKLLRKEIRRQAPEQDRELFPTRVDLK